jgi:bacillithiol system protein YtxJ
LHLLLLLAVVLPAAKQPAQWLKASFINTPQLMNWIDLNSMQQLADIKELSKTRPQVIFKHSTRCSISSMAKSRLERNEQPESGDFYFLDLIKHRSLSDKIAEDFAVTHESPQILLIKNSECVYEESHSGIQMDEIAEQMTLN